MTYLLFLALGIGLIWLGLRAKEDIYLIAAALSGSILLLWGFALTPSALQIIVEIGVIVVLFPVCIRCLLPPSFR